MAGGFQLNGCATFKIDWAKPAHSSKKPVFSCLLAYVVVPRQYFHVIKVFSALSFKLTSLMLVEHFEVANVSAKWYHWHTLKAMLLPSQRSCEASMSHLQTAQIAAGSRGPDFPLNCCSSCALAQSAWKRICLFSRGLVCQPETESPALLWGAWWSSCGAELCYVVSAE